MNENKEKEAFYKRLEKKLLQTTSFPSEYQYKFIVASDNRKLASVQKVFDGMRPTVSSRGSKNGKYTALTIQIYALDAAVVIEKYKEVSEIKGVIML